MPLTHSQALTRAVGQRLSSALPRRRTGVPPDALLPIEIWDCILHELPDDPLLRISATCRAFNDLCMPIYLVRKGIPAHSLKTGDLAIPSHLIRALQLAFYTPPIECLSCQFWVFRVHEHMASLRNLIRRSKAVRKLELIFYEDLSKTHSLAPFPRKAVMNLFRDVAYAMAERFDGPAVVVGWQDIFTCRPRDIRRWQIHEFHFCGGLGNHLRSVFQKPHPSRTTIRLHDGSSADVFPIRSIISAHIYEIPSITRRPGASSTLIVLNHEHITTLVLGYAKNSYRHSIGGAELSVILPCITLPALYSITLNTDTIDSAVLSEFLARHESLLSLEYTVARTAAHIPPLASPPVALPALNRINASDPRNILRLLDALDASPRLSNLSFCWDRSSPETTAALTALLRRLAARTADAQVQLVLPHAEHHPLDDEERTLAASLACVRAVHVNCLRQDTARALLPWLALLPRLQQVDFGFLMVKADADEKAKFVWEVKAALPGGVDVLA
ncbi:hypothetical protein DFH09DRAFT_100157 [Mycena vulgaris]|nr:hypothetical protein DFH09DRAFT_326753 [Mycena vulgaris]KAJ6535853.1 hypothetical protein DFH09DRAFT_100157 [Mycena vulgaris]